MTAATLTREQVLEHALRALVRDGDVGHAILKLRTTGRDLDEHAARLLEALDDDEGQR